MPRHGPSVRRQWVSFIAGWLGFGVVLVGLAAWEAVRVAEARATVRPAGLRLRAYPTGQAMACRPTLGRTAAS
jgi:hypothetical protein